MKETLQAASRREDQGSVFASLTEFGLIEYDKSSEYLTLQPGAYRLDGWSLTTFGWQLTPA